VAMAMAMAAAGWWGVLGGWQCVGIVSDGMGVRGAVRECWASYGTASVRRRGEFIARQWRRGVVLGRIWICCIGACALEGIQRKFNRR